MKDFNAMWNYSMSIKSAISLHHHALANFVCSYIAAETLRISKERERNERKGKERQEKKGKEKTTKREQTSEFQTYEGELCRSPPSTMHTRTAIGQVRGVGTMSSESVREAPERLVASHLKRSKSNDHSVCLDAYISRIPSRHTREDVQRVLFQ